MVAAHGGALANLIFCKEGTAVVEVGWASPCASHYEHVSAALSLSYTRVIAAKDPLGRGLGVPEIELAASSGESNDRMMDLHAALDAVAKI